MVATPNAGDGTQDLALELAVDVAGAVPDPEIPTLSLADLGVLRGAVRHAGRIVVRITPTYTGCPATLAIRLAVEAALLEAGFADASVETVLSPPWTTDDITETGRRKLRDDGIAPPARATGKGGLLFGVETVACPRCSSTATIRLAAFGSTACKALWRCQSCREPFEYFKCL